MSICIILPGEWTEAQAQVMNYTRQLADLMRLRDWELRLLAERGDTTPEQGEADENDPEGAMTIASMTVMPGDQIGGLRFDPVLVTWPAEEIRHALVHELLHIHFDRAASTIDFGGQMSFAQTEAFTLLQFQHELGMENGINATARTLAPFLPLPDWKMAA